MKSPQKENFEIEVQNLSEHKELDFQILVSVQFIKMFFRSKHALLGTKISEAGQGSWEGDNTRLQYSMLASMFAGTTFKSFLNRLVLFWGAQ